MKAINVVVAASACNLLIPINELRTLEDSVHRMLGLDVTSQATKDLFSADILYSFQDGTDASGKHCVAPLVHVMLSERLSQHVFEGIQDQECPYLPVVKNLPSSARAMDWIVVFHLKAFSRVQDMVFTEYRKLLKAGDGVESFLTDRVKVDFDKALRPHECYAIDGADILSPAPLGKYPAWQTTTVIIDGCQVRVRQANAAHLMLPEHTTATLEEAVERANGAEERIRAMTGGERMFRVQVGYPGGEDASGVVQATGRNLFDAIRAIHENGLIGFFTQFGDLRYLADIEGHQIDLAVGIGKFIADLAMQASDPNLGGRSIDGSGVESYPGTKVTIEQATGLSEKFIWTTPVGSQLQARAAVLTADVIAAVRAAERDPGKGEFSLSLDATMPKIFHIAPFSQRLKELLGSVAADIAKRHELVIVTDPNLQQAYAVATSKGEEICITRGIGYSVTKNFEIR